MAYLATIRKLIEQEFNTYWTANGGSTPLFWEGVRFEQPADSIWIRFGVLFGEAIQRSLGSTPLEMQPGVAQCQVIRPEGEGHGNSLATADLIASALRYKQLKEGSTTVDMMAPQIIGPQTRKSQGTQKASYLYTLVSIPFEAQQVQT